MAQASELTNQVFTNNQLPGKQTKQISTTGTRLSNISTSTSINKKLPTPSPSSYTFAPRWMAKTSHESNSRPTSPTSTITDENFPSLSTPGEEGKKKRSVWNDPSIVKRKVISPGAGGAVPSSAEGNGTDDPFAGMNNLVDYQQEIERLKALVPKVENKKRTSPTARPKSTGSDLKQQQQQQRLLWNDLRSAASSVAASRSADSSVKSIRVSSVSPTVQPMVTDMLLSSVSSSSASSCELSSNASSVASDDDIKSTPCSSQSVTDESQSSEDKEELHNHNHHQQHHHHHIQSQQIHHQHNHHHMESVSTSVISEEEKTRFLEFMRSWTGGWQGWDKNDYHIDGIRKEGSLWTNQSPWEGKHRSWHESKARPESIAISMPTQSRFTNEAFIQSEPSTPRGHAMYEPYFAERTIVTTPSKHEELFQRHNHHHYHHPYHNPHQHQQQQNMRYGQQPPTTNHYEPLGAIGERNNVRGLPRMGNGGAPFGVFVM
ncbi:hypothetical protein BDC45DRAFT_533582 [Circinella umbellata]|nr:hypothetical protein BDC45DRAFT_533582 [Circinella umbellata]